MNEPKIYVRILVNFILTLGVILSIFLLGPKLLRFFMPFVIAFVISSIANPIVRFLDKKVKIARKYGVDYAIKKVKTEDKPKYVIFFKACDADALTQAFTEYTRKSAEREKKPSVLQKLRDIGAKVQNKVLERTKTKQRSAER